MQNKVLVDSTASYPAVAKPESPGNSLWRIVRHRLYLCTLIWERPASAAVLALWIYACLTVVLYRDISATTRYAYYNLLSDAFLHGQLHLRMVPADTLDLSLYDGRYYLYWGPFPALLLLPFVAVFGLYFSDVIFTLGVATVTVAMVALLLRVACRQGLIDISPLQRGLLVLFFAFGTVHVTLAPFGLVWSTAQLVGIACVTAAYLAAIRTTGLRAFILTSLALTAAMLTRNHLILAGLWPAIYLLAQHSSLPRRRLAGYVVAGVLPVILGVSFIALYNWLRFNSPMENGIAYHLMNDVFITDYSRFGAFNLHYVPVNLYYQYLYYPYPVRATTPFGGSLFLLSPVFFAVFSSLRHARIRWHVWVLLATILLVNIPILLCMGTGYVQFGPRYTLDFTIPLLLLTAMGIRRWPSWLLALLTIISIIHYLPGAIIKNLLT